MRILKLASAVTADKTYKGIGSAVDQHTDVGMPEGVENQTGNIAQPLGDGLKSCGFNQLLSVP